MPATRRPVAEPDEEPNRPQADAHPRAGNHRRPEEGAPTVVGQIYVSIHGTAPAAAASEARRIARAARSTGVLVAGINVRLTAPNPGAPTITVAQANAYADGHPLRVQIAAPPLPQALPHLTQRAARPGAAPGRLPPIRCRRGPAGQTRSAPPVLHRPRHRPRPRPLPALRRKLRPDHRHSRLENEAASRPIHPPPRVTPRHRTPAPGGGRPGGNHRPARPRSGEKPPRTAPRSTPPTHS